MAIRVDVWSDFVCPWCFLVSTSLEQLKKSHGLEVHWRSYELRPEGAPPMPEEYREYILADRPRLKMIAWEHYGVELDAGPLGISSRAALIGDAYARLEGKGDAYHDKVFRAYWQQAQDISDVGILTDLAVSVGLDAAVFRAALADPAYNEAVELDVQQAYQYGLQGVPALIFESKYLVSGTQPYDTLVGIVEKVQTMQGQNA